MTPKPAARSLLPRWFEPQPAVLPEDEPLICIRDGAVAQVVLNRPDKRNAMSAAMWGGLAPLMAGLDADASVKLVVLRGAGTETFPLVRTFPNLPRLLPMPRAPPATTPRSGARSCR